jgi:hypothetical protein
MPHTTAGYGFERKVLAFAAGLSATLTGGEPSQTFVMVLRSDGSAQPPQLECPQGDWHRLVDTLAKTGAAHLFYDPFDAPEYTWLSWHQIECSTMERLIGITFENADFVKAQHSSSRVPGLKPPGTFPASWSVMF